VALDEAAGVLDPGALAEEVVVEGLADAEGVAVGEGLGVAVVDELGTDVGIRPDSRGLWRTLPSHALSQEHSATGAEYAITA